ncbi:DUF2752 domain-containing protein [Nocardioides sp. R-C-SC26]|uniref:DUF2752 domain-containing protein n=1 Tax=Nocardioides sp. R-C-SC26 TaxID=2870414 RepID=UPI001E4AB377|nr:DUF2752 domain-containing protein [Nocardioides sp. R-C-SC26]
MPGGIVVTHVVAVGAVGALATAALLSPDGIEDGPIICPFRMLTGLPCPGCGLTRAWVYAMHGRWSDSLTANPFGVVSMVLAAALVLAVVFALVRRRAAPDLDVVVRRPVIVAIVVAWLGFAAVRLVSAF